jgi:hypothetical protein
MTRKKQIEDRAFELYPHALPVVRETFAEGAEWADANGFSNLGITQSKLMIAIKALEEYSTGNLGHPDWAIKALEELEKVGK